MTVEPVAESPPASLARKNRTGLLRFWPGRSSSERAMIVQALGEVQATQVQLVAGQANIVRTQAALVSAIDRLAQAIDVEDESSQPSTSLDGDVTTYPRDQDETL